MTREDWLEKAVEELRPLFDAVGFSIPERVRVSCGWPSRQGLSLKNTRIGECWHSEAAEDHIHQIFISPLMHKGLEALDVLVHELCHAALPDGVGHGSKFKKLAKKVGLEGKATATHAGLELYQRLSDLAGRLGEYPQAKLTPKVKERKRQQGRMLKIECPANDQHGKTIILRGAKEAILKLPTCWCGLEFVKPEDDEEDEE